MLPNPFRVKPGGDLEDKVISGRASCLHRSEPMGKLVDAEVLSEELNDTWPDGGHR
jgi:hypothetical protein